MARRGEFKEIPFGWCLSGQHEQCVVKVGKLKCPCTCGDKHGINPPKLKGVSPLMQSVMDKFYK